MIDPDPNCCIYSITTRIRQYEIDLFDMHVPISEIKAMSFNELKYWCGYSKLIRQAKLDAIKKSQV